MNLKKLIKTFKSLPPLIRGLVILGLLIALIGIASHREIVESIIHALQACPVIIILRSDPQIEQSEEGSPPPQPLQKQQRSHMDM